MSVQKWDPEAKSALLELRKWQKARPSETAPVEERIHSLEWIADILSRLARYGPPSVQDALIESEQHRRKAQALREELKERQAGASTTDAAPGRSAVRGMQSVTAPVGGRNRNRW